MAWTTPRTWATLEQITATYLNEQLRDNLEYLYNRPHSFVTIRNGTNVNITSTSFAALDDGQFTLELTTTGGDIEIWLTGTFEHGSGGVAVMFDVLMDNTTYLSSMTGTPLTNGLAAFFAPNVGYDTITSLRYTISGITADTHNFKLRVRTTSGTGVWLAANYCTQFGVREI